MGATSQHFSFGELACKDGCWTNGCTQELVDALEALRLVVGRPVRVNSAYRCKAHNKAVGGAVRSQHLLGKAADVRVDGLSAAQIEAAANQVPAIKGIGRSDAEGFVHVDVRATRARWCYDARGRHRAYYKAPEALT